VMLPLSQHQLFLNVRFFPFFSGDPLWHNIAATFVVGPPDRLLNCQAEEPAETSLRSATPNFGDRALSGLGLPTFIIDPSVGAKLSCLMGVVTVRLCIEGIARA
jgi:hypothetical protein